MGHKAYPIQVWFLSNNLEESAAFVADKHLSRCISGSFNALISARMYFLGIRTKKAYDYYFSKERKLDTLADKFPGWPFKKLPKMGNYSSRYSKFVRQCKEHYDFAFKYFQILLDEYFIRFQKDHELKEADYWLTTNSLEIPLANLKDDIVIPWKVLPPRYRDLNIIYGYRKYYSAIIANDGLKMDSYSKRDIPQFLFDNNVQLIY